ncbi:MAG TPA: aldo/keto reductase [Caldimonas sp.]|jgi:diketogulonate reductase-like aldo/keto reductase|nr:aldo/keto reductase [Caldimonas sp.]HEX2542320.1 aldo/keto reductase [Caldimonas sp.]
MVIFPGPEPRPALGLGTWRMGESAAKRRAETAAVRLALDMGWRVIDTAEMYGEGGAEEVVGAAVAEALRAGKLSRDDLFVVSKVYPHNASAAGVERACERSLKRLRLDHLDAYLLHWRGSVPLAETVSAFESLRERGRIRHWGVSNFDLNDMQELMDVDGGTRCATNQVYYSLTARGAGFDLLPWQQARGIVTMAYSPVDQGSLARNAALTRLAQARGTTAAQLALAWLLAQPGVMAIPKAVREAHLRENLASGSLALTAAELAALDGIFPPPAGKTALAMR